MKPNKTFPPENCYFCETLKPTNLNKRKSDHIELAFESQLAQNDGRFFYEPLFAPSPYEVHLAETTIGSKTMRAPIWISSMTGGAEKAGLINQNLAKVAREYGLGMGLGSCRPVIEEKESAKDFQIRHLIGDQPLYANLGIAQIEEYIQQGMSNRMLELVKSLEADGLIIHVNPLQEWFQPEGDQFKNPPIDTIKRTIDLLDTSIMVKEVGQGFGPKSIETLLQLPLEALDFGSFGGTNFAVLENHRRNDIRKEEWKPATHIGHTAEEMSDWVNDYIEHHNDKIKTKHIIVSGGIKNFMDGYYYTQKIITSAIYAQASGFLKYALLGEQELFEYVDAQIEGLKMCQQYLQIRK